MQQSQRHLGIETEAMHQCGRRGVGGVVPALTGDRRRHRIEIRCRAPFDRVGVVGCAARWRHGRRRWPVCVPGRRIAVPSPDHRLGEGGEAKQR